MAVLYSLHAEESMVPQSYMVLKAKAEALQKYIASQKSKKLFGGIVIQKNYAWLINYNKIFDWEKCERGIWDEWEVLRL